MVRSRFLLAGLLAIGLSACGGSAAAPAASGTAASGAAKASSAPAAGASGASKPATSGAGTASAKPASSAGGAAKPLTPVKSAFVSISAHTLPIWLAADKGFFKQQGLDVSVAYVEGSVTAIPALSTGDLQIIEATPAASVQAQLKGQDTVALATHIPYADYRLMGLPEIKTVQDLKGKAIGATKAGTVDDVVIKYVLTKLGFTPGKDISITYLNTQPAQIAALQQKIIQASPLSPPNDVAAEKVGAHEVLNILKEHFAYPVDGIIASRKFVREHPDETDAFLKGYMQAIRYIKSNPEETKKELSVRAKIDDKQVLDEGYQVMVEALADDPTPKTDGIATVLPLFDGQGKNPADFIDPAPMARALKELGPQRAG